MSTQRSIHEIAPPLEMAEAELKATAYYFQQIGQAGFNLGHKHWPKELRMRIGAYVRRPSRQMLESLANQLSSQSLTFTHENFKSMGSSIADRIHPAITGALILDRALDAVKVDTVGINASTLPINSLMAESAIRAMWKAANIQEADIEDARRLFIAASQTEDPHLHWYIPKTRQIEQALRIRSETEAWMGRIKLEEEDIEGLSRANDELNTSLTTLQKYGLKPCIAPSVTGNATREWLVLRPIDEEFRNLYEAYNPALDQVATFYGSTKPIETTETESENFISYYDNGMKVSSNSSAIKGITQESGTLRAGLGRDGHLYYPHSGLKLMDYLNPSLHPQYEELRSELLAIYFDSVVPVYISEQVQNEAGASKKMLGRLAVGLKKKPSLRRLILARQRILTENLDNIGEELENPDKDISGGPSRDLVKHDVTWHIRRLPSNYKASPEARDLCFRETGIMLAEYGETYVKDHTRGSIDGKSKGHKAVFVAGQIATKRQKKRKR